MVASGKQNTPEGKTAMKPFTCMRAIIALGGMLFGVLTLDRRLNS